MTVRAKTPTRRISLNVPLFAGHAKHGNDANREISPAYGARINAMLHGKTLGA